MDRRTIRPAAVLMCAACGFSFAQAVDVNAHAEESVELLRNYLRIDTTNPPGNEMRAVKFFAEIFEDEGIDYQVFESAPGRGNIYARLDGGDEPGLLLSHHADVVPADENQWDYPPFSAEVDDGYIYGRGALDNKLAGIYHLQAFLALHRSSRDLRRDVAFLAVADEEAGGAQGMGWLAEHHPEIFDGMGFALNEGGGPLLLDDDIVFEVEGAHKGAVWIRLTAHGEPGHGSQPRAESAVTRLLDALEKIRERPRNVRLTPHVRAYLQGMAPFLEEDWKAAFQNIDQSIQDASFQARLLEEKRWYHALLYDTVAITMLEGSDKVNVVPGEASAELDCRILPDREPEAFVAELRALIDDPQVEVEVTQVVMPSSSTTDSELYRAIDRVRQVWYPQSHMVPMAMTGFTDSRFIRDVGIVCYGFDPALLTEDEFEGVHGHNERVSVENVKNGTCFTWDVVQELACR